MAGVQTVVQTSVWQSSDTRLIYIKMLGLFRLSILRAIKYFGDFQIKLWPSVALHICRWV